MEFPKGLANNPFVTIPFGIIIGFILNIVYENWKNKKITKQILITVHNEIINNLAKNTYAEISRMAPKIEYKRLSTTSKNIFISKIGTLTIPSEQISSILKIYEIFNFINNTIVDLKNIKNEYHDLFIIKVQIRKYYLDLIEEVCEYKKKWKLNIDI